MSYLFANNNFFPPCFSSSFLLENVLSIWICCWCLARSPLIQNFSLRWCLFGLTLFYQALFLGYLVHYCSTRHRKKMVKDHLVLNIFHAITNNRTENKRLRRKAKNIHTKYDARNTDWKEEKETSRKLFFSHQNRKMCGKK